MKEEREVKISKATIQRLPAYLRCLQSFRKEGIRTVTSTMVAEALGLNSIQVRKDLASVSGAGKPKVGYEKEVLIGDIERHLGFNKLTNAVLVGAGKLGRALLDYDGFEDFGVRIVAGFDSDEQVVNATAGSREILPMGDLSDYCAKNDVRLGIITVGQEAAQNVCDVLVGAGIEAIWNFAPCALNVPYGVILKQENLALSLAHLNNQISK